MIGVVDRDFLPAAQSHPVLDGGGGAEQREVELALEALLDDLHVQQPEKAAAESKAKGGRGLWLVDKRGIVELELFERLFELLVLFRVRGEEPGEHHRRHVPGSAKRRRRRRRL